MDLFGDFGIAGGSNPTANTYQDAQTLINWYVEISPSKASKMVAALLGCPGLVPLAAGAGGGLAGYTADNYILTADADSFGLNAWNPPSQITNLPVRGCWVLPGYQTALVVIGATVYLATVTAQGSIVSPGTIALTQVGTLLTSAGPVSIRDNGAEGFAVIVDGPYGYFYSVSGAPVVTTVANAEVSSGANTITVEAIPDAFFVGATVSDAAGYIPSGTTIDSVEFASYQLVMSQSATGTDATDTITITTPAFGRITDPAFLGADTVGYVDGWWIFNEPGTSKFYTNSQPYAGTLNPLYYALKDSSSDHLMAVIENKEELWLVGERTTEIWYDGGGSLFPFERLVGTPLQVGCKAAHSVCQISANGNDALIWFGRNAQGENVVMMTNGFSAGVVSTPAVSDRIAQYAVTDDAIAYVYQEDTHVFYVLTFPTADRTWVYDATLPPEYAWHERLSYDPYAQQWHRHRSNAFMNFGGMRVVGDYQNGVLYQLTRAAYSDAGWPIRAVRRSPYIWNPQNRERVFMQSLQLDFKLGQGNASGLGTNPQVNLRISRDYGATYGAPIQAPMGAQGQTLNRCMFRRLGFSRGAVAEIEVIDPVNRDLVGATLKAQGP
jgi:hypothetical protein